MTQQKDEIIQIFDSIASRTSWERLYIGTIDRISYNFVTRQRAVEELLAPYLIGKALDLGCGSGDLVPFYVNKWVSYTGVDLSHNMIERAHVNYASLIQDNTAVFQMADCEALPFVAGAFDMISAVALIEYLPDPTKAFDEIARVMKTGGYALVTVPHRKCINSKVRAFLKPLRDLFFSLYLKLQKAPLAAMKSVTHFSYDQIEADFFMNSRGFVKIADRYTNFHIVLHPLDHLIPKVYMRISEQIDRGKRDQAYKNWASNYIALYRKN